ncbi:DUF4304 domain-containing protein [Cognatilysobacter bugurensis]|uniref:DUF4304 domain-containing protein n=1 Tax=Cognatilysobacter bugurensis TaxID=543356 RepID=A0A918SRM2_9GAMM|nr:DUF4304 domain-containing protein [Lysobacter bugurensis]GHA68418.1 hypothetical protein GCM10007067_00320 [Lysobacter bugurensis]
MPTECPAADAKIGRKIDYLVVGHLAPALAPLGFQRKARVLWRDEGEGEARVLQVVNLQGGKWNEGSAGEVCLNLGTQFVERMRRAAAQPGNEWMAGYVGVPDDAACQVRTRIGGTLPTTREAWWPDTLGPAQDTWLQIDMRTDLDELGALIARLVTEYGLPWLERASRGEAVEAFCFV